SRSRIVPRVDRVTLARADTDIVVTEYGVARLRGRDERARAQALIAIAHPDHRDSLERAWREIDA
ncbi:MAG: acetyl-CoA hydrolase/transferase C-terminal domain-containing protein, partial [Salinarimonas sp.]